MLITLKPRYFNWIIKCTKVIARCDSVTQTYETPSLAVNMSTLLKECINVALSTGLDDLQDLKELIRSQWQYEVSTVVNNYLKQKKWNNPSFLLSPEDLIPLKEYFLRESKRMIDNLECREIDEKSFQNLQELVYTENFV